MTNPLLGHLDYNVGSLIRGVNEVGDVMLLIPGGWWMYTLLSYHISVLQSR